MVIIIISTDENNITATNNSGIKDDEKYDNNKQ